MKTQHGCEARRNGHRELKAFWSAVAICLVLVLSGCSMFRRSAPPVTIDNVYVPQKAMHVSRVAVLPISVEANDWQAAEGREILQPVLRSELSKRQRFEIVEVTPEQLAVWTGRDAWRADEVLPHFFFEKMRNELACDAVLFTHLASYHAYEPIVLGWAMKLVDGQNTQVLWAADEVFDAGRQPVAQAAEGFGQTFRERWFHSSNQEGVLLSPRLFGQYTLGALFATLPEASR